MNKLAMPKVDRKLASKKIEIVKTLKKIIKAENVLDHEDQLRPFETDALSAYKQIPLIAVFGISAIAIPTAILSDAFNSINNKETEEDIISEPDSDDNSNNQKIDGEPYKVFLIENKDQIDIQSTSKSVYGYMSINEKFILNKNYIWYNFIYLFLSFAS